MALAENGSGKTKWILELHVNIEKTFLLGHKVEHELKRKTPFSPDGIGHPKNISALAALSLL